jgi:hypothetical protein
MKSMVPPSDRGSLRRRQSLAQLERDAALRRVSWTRRWVIAGAGALSAGFAALVASVAPGHTLGAKHMAQVTGASTASTEGSGSTAHSRPATALRMPPLASPRDLGLQGPSSDPQPAPQPDPSSQGSSDAQAQSQPQPQADPAPAPAPDPAPAPAPAATSGGS